MYTEDAPLLSETLRMLTSNDLSTGDYPMLDYQSYF